ncbi:hypothetical protein JCM8115_000816 [Rhodotorula mucilaginosa]|nr:hypothetical protein B0A53_03457 [Rhodotorula sp. CCFEE 5036]
MQASPSPGPAGTGASPSPAPAAAASLWTRHTSPDGRPYWSHPQKGSVWEKPSELKSRVELEMEKTPWKEYETGGRKYWVHNLSKETTWSMPKEISDIVARFSAPPAMPTPPPPARVGSMPPTGPGVSFRPGGPAGMSPGGPAAPPLGPSGGARSPARHNPAPLNSHTGALVPPGGSGGPHHGGGGGGYGGMAPRLAPTPMALSMTGGPGGPTPVFATHGEAEAAFKHMLGQLGVNQTWTWEMVMKEAITEPYYKALKTLAERKAAFEKYLDEQRAKEKEEMDKSIAKCRDKWNRAMDRIGGGVLMEDGVKSWWSFERGRKIMQAKCPDVWKMPRNDEERKVLFHDFVNKLRHDEEVRKREMRGRNMDKLTAIFQSLQLDLAGPVRWQDARGLIMRTPEWHRDPELQRIEPIDMITVFEDEVQRAEKELAEVRQRRAEERRRKARKAREGFNELLRELVQADQISAGTTWKSVYPLLAHDERYLALLGQPGSSPLDLFWDLVDDLDVQAEENQLVIEAVAKERGFVVDEATKEDDFFAAIKDDVRLESMDYTAIRATFEKLQHRAVRAKRDERRRAEKRIRILVDDLRYALKKVDPPIDVDTATYEEVVPLVNETDEWKALEGNEDARKQAWEKFVRRQKEKRAAEMDRVERDRLYERERDAERERDRESSRRTRRSSHAPADHEDSEMLDAGTEDGSRRQRSSRGSGALAAGHDDDGTDGVSREHRKRAASSASAADLHGTLNAGGKEDGDEERGPERKVPRLEKAGDDMSMTSVKDREEGELSAVSVPPTENGNSLSSNSSAESTNDSTTSPVLSSSPLGTLDGTSGQRGDGYEGNSLEPSANGQNGSPIDSENTETDPLIAYRRNLYKYTHSHYDRVKSDLELKQSSPPPRMTPRVK